MVREKKNAQELNIINKEKIQLIKDRIASNFYNSPKTLEFTATAIIGQLKKTN